MNSKKALWDAGLKHVAGIDEAGRGPLAGPVAAAAVILPDDPSLEVTLTGVRDSKQMTPGQREYWAGCLKEVAIDYGIGFASAEEIDTAGILPATHLAVVARAGRIAFKTRPSPAGLSNPARLPHSSDLAYQRRCALSEYRSRFRTGKNGTGSINGVIWTASIPGYGFARHKGYGTPEHLQALRRLGPCPIHRLTFHPDKTQRTGSSIISYFWEKTNFVISAAIDGININGRITSHCANPMRSGVKDRLKERYVHHCQQQAQRDQKSKVHIPV